MKHLHRNELSKELLPGRALQKAVGKDGPVTSAKMSVGYAIYSAVSGPMEPHRHAEETVIVFACDRAYARRGESPEAMEERVVLQVGDVMHFDELEWHVFEYDEGGSLEIIFIYGQTENIRPEEILK